MRNKKAKVHGNCTYSRNKNIHIIRKSLRKRQLKVLLTFAKNILCWLFSSKHFQNGPFKSYKAMQVIVAKRWGCSGPVQLKKGMKSVYTVYIYVIFSCQPVPKLKYAFLVNL